MAVKKQRKSPKMHIRKKVFKFLNENGVGSTYRDYKKATRNNPGVSDTMFYNYRSKYLEQITPEHRTEELTPPKKEHFPVASETVSGPCYATVYTKELREGDEPVFFMDDVREILKRFDIQAQVIELTDPRMVEIRSKME